MTVFFKYCSADEIKVACEKELKNLQIILTRKQEMVVDVERQRELLDFFHNDEMYGGHSGQKKLYAKLRAMGKI